MNLRQLGLDVRELYALFAMLLWVRHCSMCPRCGPWFLPAVWRAAREGRGDG